jgi:hypothetical protein
MYPGKTGKSGTTVRDPQTENAADRQDKLEVANGEVSKGGQMMMMMMIGCAVSDVEMQTLRV